MSYMHVSISTCLYIFLHRKYSRILGSLSFQEFYSQYRFCLRLAPSVHHREVYLYANTELPPCPEYDLLPLYCTIHLEYVVFNGPLARYVKLQVVPAPGMPGTFSPLPRISDPRRHHGTCVTSGFLWSQWRGKRSRHSRCMRNPQFYVSGKKPMLHQA